MSNNTNTSVVTLSVNVGGETFAPVISIADNGIWSIANHEGLKARVGADLFNEWLTDFWCGLYEV
jgi:hypothetical protein